MTAGQIERVKAKDIADKARYIGDSLLELSRDELDKLSGRMVESFMSSGAARVRRVPMTWMPIESF